MQSYDELQELPLHVLKHHFPDREEDEDLLQEGRLELWRCILDSEKVHSNFFSYAYTRIFRCYVRVLRADEPPCSSIEDTDLADTFSTTFEDDKALCESIGRILKNREEAKALCLKAKGYSYKEISKRMRIPYDKVRRLVRRGGQKLRQYGAL